MQTHPDIGFVIADLLQLAHFWLCRMFTHIKKFASPKILICYHSSVLTCGLVLDNPSASTVCNALLFNLFFSRFVKDGGCSILNKWLQEGMTSQNMPLILDVLEVGVLS